MSDAPQIGVGDHVTINGNELTWQVMAIHPIGERLVADLQSGQTGRKRAEWLERLEVHTKGKVAA